MESKDIQRDIRDWFHHQPDWLQMAAEMILTSGHVSESDIDEIVKHMKTPLGNVITSHRPYDELGSERGEEELRIRRIRGISGLENFSPSASLDFGDANLVVVYGMNGSGKSGYTRLIKKICGKMPAKELQPNVFKAPPSTRSCRVEYVLSGENRESEWTINASPITDLARIDVFDTDASVAYLTQEASASYTPRYVAIFEALANVCERVKARIQAEQNRLIAALPNLPPVYASTLAGKDYSGLKASTSDVAADAMLRWGSEDDEAISSIETRLFANPVNALKSKRSTKTEVDTLLKDIQEISERYSPGNMAYVAGLRSKRDEKRKVANEAAKLLKSDLAGVGSETWRALWEAARSYSSTVYPGLAFPVVQNSHCVLCHQGLEAEAKERLVAFEAHVQGEIEKESAAAELLLSEALGALPVSLGEVELATKCRAAGIEDAGLSAKLKEMMREVSAARQAMFDGVNPVPAVTGISNLIDVLKTHSKELESEAAQCELDASGFSLQSLSQNKLELEARRWISQQALAVRSEISRLAAFESLELLKRGAGSQKISSKAGEVAEKVITEAYVKRFNHELKALGASRIQIELVRTRSEKGKALHKLRLKGVCSGRDVPEAVLSEGERRIVALAAFLADVGDGPRLAPFVFDDPISSLDSDFEWNVAMRLGELARTRQVLVFTHRLSLLGFFEDVQKKIKDKWGGEFTIQKNYVEMYSGEVGNLGAMPGWTEKTTKLNSLLIERLGAANAAGKADGAEAYRNLAQGICSDFRKLLETTIEADLLQDVVVRHRRGVQTQGRLFKLPLLNKADCDFLDELMTRYSCFEHSQSSETPVVVPDEPVLRKDLLELKAWRDEFKKRTPTS